MSIESSRPPAADGRAIGTPAGWRTIDGQRFRIYADADADEVITFAEAVAAGLDEHPRWLPTRYLYDRRGSEIYEEITRQPEYYPTRTEDAILAAHAAEIRQLAGDSTLVEFGSGSSSKTRRLLEAWLDRGPARYVPIDISLAALESACRDLGASFDDLRLEAVRASYEHAMPLVKQLSPVTFLFLGSTIGNFDNEEVDAFLDMVSRHLNPGDTFLLGIDLVKDPGELEAAYNDAAGWSERFTLNLFRRMNRELGTAIPDDAVEHVAYYNDRLERIEIYARFRREVEVRLRAIDRSFRVAANEMIRTEISRKFRADEMAANASRFGFIHEEVLFDEARRFALLVLRRSHSAAVQENRIDDVEALLGWVRGRTHEIVAPLTDGHLADQPSPIMGPIGWDLGHVADFEQLWLVDEVARRGGSALGRSGLDPTYDPNVHTRSDRGELRLPSRREALQQLASVRERALRRLRDGAIDPTDMLTADGFVYRMVAQHESQHQETMLQAIQLRGDLAYAPPFAGSGPRRPDSSPAGASILIPAGSCVIGRDDRRITYDNERPAHRVELPAYRIDAAPVTNGEYGRFIDDGGYRRRELWSAEGWAWRRGEQAEAPLFWRRVDGHWQRLSFGRLKRVDSARPVMHVSWFEADAYARWAGKRLPCEQEWEKAAAWDPARSEARRYPWGEARPTRELANLGHRLLDTTPVGAYPRGRSFFGCHQMLGDVYEWTASDFLPYPGFEAFPYRDYSEVFFGNDYKVLRGASWAVPEFMARNTYRNWDDPQRRQIFAGFRCVADT